MLKERNLDQKPNVLDTSFHSKKVKQTKNERLFINNIYFKN